VEPRVAEKWLETLCDLHASIRGRVVEACEQSPPHRLAAVAADQGGDTIYGIDRVSEDELVGFLEPRAAALGGVVLVAEGLHEGRCVLPNGSHASAAQHVLIVDPIDGTRGLMYQKRSAWVLSAVAPNHGPNTRLSHVELAIQTEIPLVKQHLCDQLWAVRGRGVTAQRYDRIRGASVALELAPSRSDNIDHAFATVVRFFPGIRAELAAIDDEVVEAVLGRAPEGRALCFEDQYPCTGGQLYELMAGHDRFIADLRPLMHGLLRERGAPLGLCCHPYDICTALIARESGVVVTDGYGDELDVPLDVSSEVSWIGYANGALRARIEPHLRKSLEKRGLWPRPPLVV
jgi:fructose-1,6-bisphosphatase/inositol monophosphatase family enzyme